jgi:hypothetical protein
MAKSINNALEFSTQGSQVIDSASGAVTGKQFGAIQIINDAVLSVLTATNIADSSKLLSITIPAGSVIYGKVSALTVTSGVVVGHKY